MGSLDLWSFCVCGEVANIFDKVATEERFQNLCAEVGVKCKEHLDCAQAAAQTSDWVVAYSEWTSCRDVIVRSERVFLRDDWLWLSGCHALVWANLWALHSMNFGLALTGALAACKARDEVQNVAEALDFKSYAIPTLWKVMYLWASTSDCEEEKLDPDVIVFLIDVLGYPGNAVSVSDVGILKSQCKEFVIWEVQKHFAHNSKTDENFRWAREGNNLYKQRYPEELDYLSKFNEASTLFMSGACEEAIKILEEIRCNSELKPWEANGMYDHPAALYCTLQYAFFIRQMLCMWYEKTIIQPGKEKSQNMIDHANKEKDECKSLWAKIQSDGVLLPSRKCLAEAWQHAVINRWEEAEACFGTSGDQFIWAHIVAPAFLDKLHTDFKIKYRQSYESGLPDESYFSSAELWAKKLPESNNCSLCLLSQWQPRYCMKLVRLYHEKDRQVMFLKQSPIMVDEEETAPRETAPILEYGRNTIECYVEALIQHSKHDDYWVAVQELYKDLYYMLQFHHFALWIASHECTPEVTTSDIPFQDRLIQLWNESLTFKGASTEFPVSQKFLQQSFVWAERRVGKTVYFQLAPDMLPASAREQLREFDLNDDEAWNTLKTSRAACGPGTFVLEYFVSKSNDLQLVYVMTKEDEVFMQILNINSLDWTLWKILDWLRTMFSDLSHGCGREFINTCLEWIYEILISPVANLLDDMKPEDKLIIVAPEILSDVPFAALRKPGSDVGEGYLIQSHTISVTSSLRMLHHCNQRMEKLKQNGLYTKPGTIVAVGDPACKTRLKASGEEVNFIEQSFGEEHVMKLVGRNATPSEVLKWAKYPSENHVKQVIIHIAAHGIAQDGGEIKKGAIVLARPPLKFKKHSTALVPDTSCQQNYDTAGQEGTSRAKDDKFFDYDNAHGETQLGELLFSMVDVKEEVQISSHGEVGAIRNGIVVPISKKAPDILKSENISGCGFQWEAHMVVLSACDTARGQITGEGVLNLPRALMIAGVPCVVVSQWKVGDSSTCELMKSFYRELRSGKDVSSSLRAAMLKMIKDDREVRSGKDVCSSLSAGMLKMIKDGRKVHEWAPFIVCGSPTVCLPTELQDGTSSCKGQTSETSNDPTAERRVKAVKVQRLDLAARPFERFWERAHAGSDTCFHCLGKFGKDLGLMTARMVTDLAMIDGFTEELDRIENEERRNR